MKNYKKNSRFSSDRVSDSPRGGGGGGLRTPCIKIAYSGFDRLGSSLMYQD